MAKDIDIRKAWLDYFNSLGLKTIASAPLVHPLFPMSFNMSAGLVQLDPKIRSPQKVAPYKECLIQKCFRHFDLEKVGDESHLSFFEMTGAFEVGEFEETRTIQLLYDFLIGTLFLPKEKIWITSFSEQEVAEKKIKIEEKIKRYLTDLAKGRLVFGNRDNPNLWLQGGGAKFTDNMRLCGPQVEFFYDLGKEKGCGKKSCHPFCPCGRFLEIGNIIFIKYFIDCNREPVLKKLLNPSTESVIGIERTALIVEKKDNIYQTSFFEPLTKIIGEHEKVEEVRIIADHIKALTFLLAEGKIIPGKNGRNRIIRTLIRNMLASCYVLHINPQELLPQLVDGVIELYRKSYPEIRKAKENVLPVIFEHEVIFQKTLEKGKRKIQKYLQEKKITVITEKEKEYFRLQFGVPEKLIILIMYLQSSGHIPLVSRPVGRNNNELVPEI